MLGLQNSGERMIEFQPLQLALDFTAAFEVPAFGLWRDPNAIAATTYRALSPYGLQLTGLQWDSGRNIGENRLRVQGLFDYRASYEIRRDGIFVQFFQLSSEFFEQLAGSAESLLGAFANEGSGTSYGRFEFALALHGRLASEEPAAFLRSYASKVPSGLGDVRESGCVFWFAPTDERLGLSLLIEPSRRFQGALWIRVEGTLDARKVPLEAIRPGLEKIMSQALSSLDLTPPKVIER